jgi:hypothetical protein
LLFPRGDLVGVWIGVVLRAAKNVDRKPVHPEIVDEARDACRELRLIGKSRRRYRRPADSELAALDGHFQLRDMRSDIPMFDIWHFAITSTRREDEICRLLWEDNDPGTRTGLVRDAKHPEKKDGNHRRFRYTIHSGRSQTEITELRWADNDHCSRTGAIPRLDGGAHGSFGWRTFRYRIQQPDPGTADPGARSHRGDFRSIELYAWFRHLHHRV